MFHIKLELEDRKIEEEDEQWIRQLLKMFSKKGGFLAQPLMGSVLESNAYGEEARKGQSETTVERKTDLFGWKHCDD